MMKQGWSHCFARADMHSCFTENAGPSVDTSKRFCFAVLLFCSRSQVAQELGGQWLATWLLVAAALACAGQYLAEMSSDSFQLCGMARHAPRATRHAHTRAPCFLSCFALSFPRPPPWFSRHLGRHLTRQAERGWLPAIFARRSGTSGPTPWPAPSFPPRLPVLYLLERVFVRRSNMGIKSASCARMYTAVA